MKSIVDNAVRALGCIYNVLTPDEQIEKLDHAKYRTVFYPFSPKK